MTRQNQQIMIQELQNSFINNQKNNFNYTQGNEQNNDNNNDDKELKDAAEYQNEELSNFEIKEDQVQFQPKAEEHIQAELEEQEIHFKLDTDLSHIKDDEDEANQPQDEYHEIDKFYQKPTLYMSNFCPYSQIIKIMINEKNVDADLIEGYYEENNDIEYHQDLNELDKSAIPFVCDKNTLYQGAISSLKHLDSKYGTINQFFPEDKVQLEPIEKKVEFIKDRIYENFNIFVFSDDEQIPPLIPKRFLQGVEILFRQYLGPYYYGNNFSIVDMYMAPIFQRMFIIEKHRGFKIPNEYPYEYWNQWAKNVLERPSVQKSLVSNQYLYNCYEKYFFNPIVQGQVTDYTTDADQIDEEDDEDNDYVMHYPPYYDDDKIKKMIKENEMQYKAVIQKEKEEAHQARMQQKQNQQNENNFEEDPDNLKSESQF